VHTIPDALATPAAANPLGDLLALLVLDLLRHHHRQHPLPRLAVTARARMPGGLGREPKF
jgi:hypothetical protein